MSHVFITMGTVVSVQGDASAMPQVEAVFQELDEVFSLYREDSEASQIARGELLLPD